VESRHARAIGTPVVPKWFSREDFGRISRNGVTFPRRVELIIYESYCAPAAHLVPSGGDGIINGIDLAELAGEGKGN
jgi:hypothetical protein